VTQLKWSPTGDALAVALEGPDLAENGAGSGNVFVWTRDRLVRVWSAPGVQTPNIEWAPDGRSLAIWGGGLPVTVIYGDGSPDRTVDIHPAFAGNLHWSPDGSSWIFAEPTNELRGSTVSVVKVGDAQPRQLDLGQGIDNLLPVGWIDNDTVLLLDSKAAPDHSRYLKVPIAAPLAFTVVPIPDEGFAPDSNFVFSPDRTRGAYVVSGSQVVIVDVTGKYPGMHFPIDVGTDVFGVTWSPDGSQLMANTGFGVSELLLETAENGDIGRVRVAGTVDLVATGDSWQPAP
jgi:WD40 repeat protein